MGGEVHIKSAIPSLHPISLPPSLLHHPFAHLTTIPAYSPLKNSLCARVDTQTLDVVFYQTSSHGRSCRPQRTRHHSTARTLSSSISNLRASRLAQLLQQAPRIQWTTSPTVRPKSPGGPFYRRRHPNLCDRARHIRSLRPPYGWHSTVQPEAHHRGCPVEFLPGWGKNHTKRQRGSTQFTTTPVAGDRQIHQALPDLRRSLSGSLSARFPLAFSFKT